MNQTPTRALAFFEIALEWNLVDPPDVAEWATALVEATADPDPELCDLATADLLTRWELLVQIRGLVRPVPVAEVVPLMFGYLDRRVRGGTLSAGEAAKTVRRTIVEADLLEDLLDNPGLFDAFEFECEWSLATDRVVGDVREIEERILKFLAQYRDADAALYRVV